MDRPVKGSPSRKRGGVPLPGDDTHGQANRTLEHSAI